MSGLASSVQGRGRAIPPRASTMRARTSRKPVDVEPVERLNGAHVSLGCLPKLLGYSLRRAHQSSWRAYVATIGEQNIRPGLFSLLVLVQCNPGIAQIELGTHLGVDKASMVALLDRLERAALITRKRSTRDRRRQGIYLTEVGEHSLGLMIADVRVLEKQLASRYTKAELEQFMGYLHRMYR